VAEEVEEDRARRTLFVFEGGGEGVDDGVEVRTGAGVPGAVEQEDRSGGIEGGVAAGVGVDLRGCGVRPQGEDYEVGWWSWRVEGGGCGCGRGEDGGAGG
jgi:hypothetical protein